MADITVVADEGGSIVTVGEERVELEPGYAVAIERTTRTVRHKGIIKVKPLKPVAQIIVRMDDERAVVARLSDAELAEFGHDEPLTIELRGMVDLDLAQLDEVAAQADQRGVEMLVRLRRHGN